MRVYRYKFNPEKCNRFTIESNRKNLFYPCELYGSEYFSVKDNEDVEIQFGISDSIHLKNEWFDIEELDVNGFDEAIEEEVERMVEEKDKERASNLSKAIYEGFIYGL